MPRKKQIKKKVVRKSTKKPAKKKIKELKPIDELKKDPCDDIKSGLVHFIYGAIFGALLMLIFMRILQII